MSEDLPLHSADWPRLSTPGHGYDPAVAHPAFLLLLEREGNILDACRACGIDRATVNNWRKADPAFNRKVVEARKCWSEERGNLLERHALDVALRGAKNQYVHDGEVHVLRRHDGKILQAALQQFAGWGEPERQGIMAKEYIMVGADGQTFSLSSLLRAHFQPQKAPDEGIEAPSENE
jgi:hypothetical protein